MDQPKGYLAQKSTIESGVLNHHIVRLEPMTPSAIDLAELKSRQFNVNTGFRTGDSSDDKEERSTSSRTNAGKGGGSTSPRDDEGAGPLRKEQEDLYTREQL